MGLLSRGIACGQSLQHLQLFRNHLTPEGMKNLAKGLRRYTSITHLQVIENGMTDDSVKCLCSAMDSSNVKFLQLAYNTLSDAGIVCLIQETKSDSGLTCIQLVNNILSHVAREMLRKSAQTQTRLVSRELALKLSDNMERSKLDLCNSEFNRFTKVDS